MIHKKFKIIEFASTPFSHVFLLIFFLWIYFKWLKVISANLSAGEFNRCEEQASETDFHDFACF